MSSTTDRNARLCWCLVMGFFAFIFFSPFWFIFTIFLFLLVVDYVFALKDRTYVYRTRERRRRSSLPPIHSAAYIVNWEKIKRKTFAMWSFEMPIIFFNQLTVMIVRCQEIYFWNCNFCDKVTNLEKFEKFDLPHSNLIIL